MDSDFKHDDSRSHPKPHLKKISEEQLKMIDEYLASIGSYGEVHLVVQNGELRYINRVESHKAWTTGKRSEE